VKLQYIISSALLIGKSLLLFLKTPLMSILSGYLYEDFFIVTVYEKKAFLLVFVATMPRIFYLLITPKNS